MLNFFKIAANTVKESIREPIFCVLLACAMLLIGNFPFVALFVFNDQVKMVVDSSMATTLLFGLFAAVLCSSHTVSREMRDGTVLLLFSKPVFRWNFILAKIAGIIVSSMIFVLICNASSVFSLYVAIDNFRVAWGVYYAFLGIMAIGAGCGMVMNFIRGSSFSAIFSLFQLVAMPLGAIIIMIFREAPPEIILSDFLLAITLLFLAVAAMATLSVVFATRLDMVANLTVSSVLFALGLMSHYLFNPSTANSFGFVKSILYALLPNWQFFWLADALATRQSIPLVYLGWSCCYVILYIGLCAFWAILVFQDKEIAKDAR